MASERPGPPNLPGRPAVSAFHAAPPSQATTPFTSSGPFTGSYGPGFRPAPPVRFNGPAVPPNPSYLSSEPLNNQQFSAPNFSSLRATTGSAQPFSPPTFNPPSNFPLQAPVSSVLPFSPHAPNPPLNYPSQPPPSSGQPFSPPSLSTARPTFSHRPLSPQQQIPSIPMRPPLQSVPFAPPTATAFSPPTDAIYHGSRPNGPPIVQGYANRPINSATQISTVTSSFTNQGVYATQPPVSPYLSNQGSAMPQPPMGAPLGQQLQYVGGPPLGSGQGLVEDFSSLSIASVPGSFDSGIDPKALPRPLEGDVEPSLLYPQNCHCRYFRLTTSVIPNSQSLLSRWHLPLGAVIHPLAEAPDGEEIPIVNFGPTGIIRCRRCRTYINPFVTFADSGRKWRCNICALLNDVPGDYFSLLDANGRRSDADERPELSKGSVEYVAPTEYMVRPPMPPLYFFLIDVSFHAVKSGMLEVVAKTIKSCLDELPGFPRTQIGFITYDSALHFYNMKSSLTQPQMMVVTDLEDIFVPLPDDLLVNLSESRNVVDAFLDSLPSMFQDSVNIESAFGSALKASLMVMSQLGGKLLIFQSTLPSIGVGRLKLRGDDLRVYGTDKEPATRAPEDPFYKQMAADMTKYQIGVNVYTFSENYTDIASLGTLAKYTGGQVYYYPSFQQVIHGEKLRHDLARDLTRETAWEAVMRIRCGKGVRFSTYHGHFMLRSTDLMALPAVDCDKAFAVQIAYEESLLSTQTIYFQIALLYTSSSGERRIRVHTAAAPVVQDLGEMYRHADTGAIVSVLSRVGIEKSLSIKLENVRQSLQLRIVKGLKEYRNLYAVQNRLTGRLIYPETLKYLALYGLAISKSIALGRGFTDVKLDERCAAGHSMMTLPVKKLLKFLYPSLSRIDEYLLKGPTNNEDMTNIVKPLPLSFATMDARGLYLFDDGFRFIIWFGRSLSPEIVVNLVGADFPDMSRVMFSERDNDTSRKLCNLLERIRESDPSSYPLCHLVRQGEQPGESLLLNNLIDDPAGGPSYVEYIQQIYRQVQQGA